MSEVITPARLLGATTIDGTPWAANLRAAGRSAFERLGIPHRRDEAFRYSDLRATLQRTPPAADAPRPRCDLSNAVLVRIAGGAVHGAPPIGAVTLAAAMADPASVFAPVIGTVNAAEQGSHPIAALNAARVEGGLVLVVSAGTTAAPLQLDFEWAPGEERHLRIVVVVEAGAALTLAETHRGNPGLGTVVTEFRLAEGAKLTHLRVDRLGAAARMSTVVLGEVSRAASYDAFMLCEGGDFCRADALVALTGESAHVALDGALLSADARHVDVTAVLTHAAPATSSRQSFRAVLGGKARAAYQGCIKVRPHAQKTDAYQMSRALLLSPRAFIATKPELEIYADDVKCSHGAAAGELSQDALFFLRSRGLTEAEARALLVDAFVNEALEAIADPALHAFASAAAAEWMTAHAREVTHA